MAVVISDKVPSSKEEVEKILSLCPFSAIHQEENGRFSIDAGCKMCRMCVKKVPEYFSWQEETAKGPVLNKEEWKGIAVVAEMAGENSIHPVSLELLGKARELAAKVGHKVYAVLAGKNLGELPQLLIEYGADIVYTYEDEALEFFRIEPYTAILEDFIKEVKPCTVLVGGTPSGRTWAPRAAARFRTGLTADCTILDIRENSDLEQIRPAFGGNIMAHINTPSHRPQFATVRYKIFPLPAREEKRKGEVVKRTLPAAQLSSAIEILSHTPKKEEKGIEEAEVIVAVGKGVKKAEDLAMFKSLARHLHGEIACTRCMVEAGLLDHKRQIGLSGRTVAPKLIICCGISGSVQFAAGMKGAEKIIAINLDKDAPIFKLAHIGIVGDIYKIVPELLEKMEKGGR